MSSMAPAFSADDTGLHVFVFRMFLMVLLFINSVSGQCMRSLRILTATEEYQTFTSPGYPLYYYSSRTCSWHLYAVNDSYAIKLDVLDCSIEYDETCQFDYCQVFDGNTIYQASLGRFCGTSTPTFISNNNTILFQFVSDASVTSRGFKARYKAGPRASLFDDLNEPDNTSVIIGVSVGSVAFLVVVSIVVVIAYKRYKAKKSAPRRPQPRPQTSIRVRPCENNIDTSYYDTYFPPAYEDIQASPPPEYSSSNRTPQPAALPRRIDVMTDYGRYGDKKAPWRKEPLDTIHGIDSVSNTNYGQSTSQRQILTDIETNDPFSSEPSASGVSSVNKEEILMLNTRSGFDRIGKTRFLASSAHAGKEKSEKLVMRETAFRDPVPSTAQGKIQTCETNLMQSERISSVVSQQMPDYRKSLNRIQDASCRGKSFAKNIKSQDICLFDNKDITANQSSRNGENTLCAQERETQEPEEIIAEDIDSITSEDSMPC